MSVQVCNGLEELWLRRDELETTLRFATRYGWTPPPGFSVEAREGFVLDETNTVELRRALEKALREVLEPRLESGELGPEDRRTAYMLRLNAKHLVSLCQLDYLRFWDI